MTADYIEFRINIQLFIVFTFFFERWIFFLFFVLDFFFGRGRMRLLSRNNKYFFFPGVYFFVFCVVYNLLIFSEYFLITFCISLRNNCFYNVVIFITC